MSQTCSDKQNMASQASKFFSVYRISKTDYISDKKGTGSFKYGGRWNTKGYRVIYSSESQSLAFCEILSNLNTSIFPPHLSVIEIEIPARISIKPVSLNMLPENWRNPGAIECRNIGKEWLQDQKYCVLKVPSAVITGEFNYILNISHPEFKKLKFNKAKKFLPDERIVTKLS